MADSVMLFPQLLQPTACLEDLYAYERQNSGGEPGNRNSTAMKELADGLVRPPVSSRRTGPRLENKLNA